MLQDFLDADTPIWPLPLGNSHIPGPRPIQNCQCLWAGSRAQPVDFTMIRWESFQACSHLGADLSSANAQKVFSTTVLLALLWYCAPFRKLEHWANMDVATQLNDWMKCDEMCACVHWVRLLWALLQHTSLRLEAIEDNYGGGDDFI